MEQEEVPIYLPTVSERKIAVDVDLPSLYEPRITLCQEVDNRYYKNITGTTR